jgi:hypothetical protein
MDFRKQLQERLRSERVEKRIEEERGLRREAFRLTAKKIVPFALCAVGAGLFSSRVLGWSKAS